MLKKKELPEPKKFKGFQALHGIMIQCQNCRQRSQFNDIVYWKKSIDNSSSEVYCARCMDESKGTAEAKKEV